MHFALLDMYVWMKNKSKVLESVWTVPCFGQVEATKNGTLVFEYFKPKWTIFHYNRAITI